MASSTTEVVHNLGDFYLINKFKNKIQILLEELFAS